MILLDTHTLVWFLTSPDKLSLTSKNAIESNYKKTPILISSISIWEICQLVNKGKIDFSVNLEDWLTELNKKSAFQFVVIDNIIAYNSQALPGNFHKDPADRFIVATAIQLGATIVTKDQKIRRYKHVKTIW